MEAGYDRIVPVMSGWDDKWPMAGPGQFTTAHLDGGAAGEGKRAAEGQEALSRLCQSYWTPCYISSRLWARKLVRR